MASGEFRIGGQLRNNLEPQNFITVNARANQFAHYLRRRGVGPDVFVGICLERSPELVVGLLGFVFPRITPLLRVRDIQLPLPTRIILAMSTFDASHGQRVVIYGTTELAELAYLSLREMNIDCVGFIDGSSRETFLSCPVSSPDKISRWQFDWVLITDLEHAAACEERLVQSGVPRQKVLRLGLRE